MRRQQAEARWQREEALRLQAEARQRVVDVLGAAVDAAHKAIEADDAQAVAQALPAVVDQQYKVRWLGLLVCHVEKQHAAVVRLPSLASPCCALLGYILQTLSCFLCLPPTQPACRTCEGRCCLWAAWRPGLRPLRSRQAAWPSFAQWRRSASECAVGVRGALGVPSWGCRLHSAPRLSHRVCFHARFPCQHSRVWLLFFMNML